ncbi:unnamed protein product [Orchesella dallaii]|uniref:Uncharacterized protein n=1 Tax=Orchesella dallaii TaxID=48710 RepID=A0ABP1R3E6_9HEXA
MDNLNPSEVAVTGDSEKFARLLNIRKQVYDIMEGRLESIRYVERVSRLIRSQYKSLRNLEKVLIKLQNALFQRAFKGQVNYVEARKVLKKVNQTYFKLKMKFRNFGKRYKAFNMRIVKESNEWLTNAPSNRLPDWPNLPEELFQSALKEWENGNEWSNEILREVRTFHMEWKQLGNKWGVDTARSLNRILPLMMALSNSA